MTGSKGSPSGQVQAERLDLGQHAVQCRPVQQAGDCWSGVGGWISRCSRRSWRPTCTAPPPARSTTWSGALGADSGIAKSEVSWICAELGRSGGVPGPQPGRAAVSVHVLGRASPAAEVKAGRRPPVRAWPSPRREHRHTVASPGSDHVHGGVASGTSAGSTSCATCSLRSRRATPTGSLPQSAPSSPNRTPRRAREPPVLRCPALADHRDPVTTNHLPGGKPESAAKTRTARLRRST